MLYNEALHIAKNVKTLLAPHCDRIEIAGSIRRKRPQVKDIEIVAIPKPYDTGLFESGVATVINRWPAVKGHLPCKYTQRLLPEGIALDIFFAEPDNWGYILALRTGSAAYSHMLAGRWVKRRYHGKDGYLYLGHTKKLVPEEQDLFKLVQLRYCSPEKEKYEQPNSRGRSSFRGRRFFNPTLVIARNEAIPSGIPVYRTRNALFQPVTKLLHADYQ